MSATIREQIIRPDKGTAPMMDRIVPMHRQGHPRRISPKDWQAAQSEARALALTRGRRVRVIITPGLSSGMAYLDMYVEPEP